MDQDIRKYLSHRQVQDYLLRFYENSGHRCNVNDAVQFLASEGLCTTMPGAEPDYDLWDELDPAMLMELFLDSPLDVTPLLRDHHFYENDLALETINFFERDVWPIMCLRNESIHLRKQDCFCLQYVMQGKMELTIGKDVHFLEKGCAVLLAPCLLFGTIYPEDTIVFSMNIKQSTFRQAFSSLFAKDNGLSSFFSNCLYGGLQNYLLFYHPDQKRIFSLIRNILREAVSSRLYATEIGNAYVAILFGELFRNYNSALLHFSENRSVHSQMPLILSYIRGNCNAPLSQVAEFFGYDRDYLGKLIKKSTGQYFTDIANSYKLEKAHRLLLYTDDSVEHIGERCGFSSPNHFSRTFRKYKGTTPSRYRKEHSPAE